jgi:ArsR family transcriptional regulator, arsenate/arsenite/antimonite-responsive transcriptional repressor
MDQSQALNAFAALSQATRLEIVGLLVRAGTGGMSAGSIAEAVSASPSNVSFHVKELERAGLIEARRESRSIIYRANYGGLRALIAYLMQDCCAGRVEICGPQSLPSGACVSEESRGKVRKSKNTTR